MLIPRILTALVLLPLMLGMLFYANDSVWAIFSGCIALLALGEYARIVKMPQRMLLSYMAMSVAVGFVAWKYQYRLNIVEHALVLCFWLLIVPLWLVKKWPSPKYFFAIVVGWLLMFPFWLALIILRPETKDAPALLAVMGLVWVADTGAYVFGRLFGKHKIAPSISPGKSWEGAIGGFVCVLIYAFAVQSQGWWAFEVSPMVLILFALLLTIVSITGDFFESHLKREAKVKDSSNLLPGHGGVFDRVDSLIAVLSVYAALLLFASQWMVR